MRLPESLLVIACGTLILATDAFAAAAENASAPEQSEPYHKHEDRHHGHNHFYPDRGSIVRELPHGAVVVNYAGVSYRFYEGIWFEPHGPAYLVVMPPIGLIVPSVPSFATMVDAQSEPYLYANDVYYRARPDLGGYEIVNDPADTPARSGTATAGSGARASAPNVQGAPAVAAAVPAAAASVPATTAAAVPAAAAATVPAAAAPPTPSVVPTPTPAPTYTATAPPPPTSPVAAAMYAQPPAGAQLTQPSAPTPQPPVQTAQPPAAVPQAIAQAPQLPAQPPQPPPQASQLPAPMPQPASVAQPVLASGSARALAVPRTAKSQDEQARDHYDCYRFAVAQSGYDPMRTNAPSAQAAGEAEYERAQAACFEARGYAVR